MEQQLLYTLQTISNCYSLPQNAYHLVDDRTRKWAAVARPKTTQSKVRIEIGAFGPMESGIWFLGTKKPKLDCPPSCVVASWRTTFPFIGRGQLN